MTRLTANVIITSSILGTLATAAFVGSWSADRERALVTEHGAELDRLNAGWARQAPVLKRAALREDEVLGRQRNQRMQEFLGGSARAAKCNPNFTIQQMLESATLGCCPVDASVSVEVERFTEFEIKIVLNQPLDLSHLAEITLCTMRQGVPYAKSLVFICNNRVIAELDDHAIESVADWTRVTGQQVALLLSNPDAEPGPKVVVKEKESVL